MYEMLTDIRIRFQFAAYSISQRGLYDIQTTSLLFGEIGHIVVSFYEWQEKTTSYKRLLVHLFELN